VNQFSNNIKNNIFHNFKIPLLYQFMKTALYLTSKRKKEQILQKQAKTIYQLR